MEDVFEKLLLSNDILSEEELDHYKKLQEATPDKHLEKFCSKKG